MDSNMDINGYNFKQWPLRAKKRTGISEGVCNPSQFWTSYSSEKENRLYNKLLEEPTKSSSLAYNGFPDGNKLTHQKLKQVKGWKNELRFIVVIFWNTNVYTPYATNKNQHIKVGHHKKSINSWLLFNAMSYLIESDFSRSASSFSSASRARSSISYEKFRKTISKRNYNLCPKKIELWYWPDVEPRPQLAVDMP